MVGRNLQAGLFAWIEVTCCVISLEKSLREWGGFFSTLSAVCLLPESTHCFRTEFIPNPSPPPKGLKNYLHNFQNKSGTFVVLSLEGPGRNH